MTAPFVMPTHSLWLKPSRGAEAVSGRMQPHSGAGRNPRCGSAFSVLMHGFSMSPRSARHAVLSEISPFEGDGDVRIVIETPRGSRSKYSYDSECDCMQLDRTAGRHGLSL
jgi:hypothetical protein